MGRAKAGTASYLHAGRLNETAIAFGCGLRQGGAVIILLAWQTL